MSRLVRPLLRLALASSLVLVFGGCFRYHTHVPGVVDMRTDGEDADLARPRLQGTEREAAVAVFIGRGVHRDRDRVVVEERHYWVGGLIPLLNTSAADEVALALGRSRALRDFELKEEIGLTEGLVANALPLLVPVSSYVLPTYTFTVSGIAIEPSGDASSAPTRRRPLPQRSDTPLSDVASPEPPPADTPPPPVLLELDGDGAMK